MAKFLWENAFFVKIERFTSAPADAALEPLWSRFGAALELLWNRFGAALESLWSRFLVVVFIGFSQSDRIKPQSDCEKPIEKRTAECGFPHSAVPSRTPPSLRFHWFFIVGLKPGCNPTVKKQWKRRGDPPPYGFLHSDHQPPPPTTHYPLPTKPGGVTSDPAATGPAECAKRLNPPRGLSPPGV